MIRKLFLVSIMVLTLPVAESIYSSAAKASKPFNSIAVAGRTQAGGGYCDCGTPDCITEPGECGNSNAATVASGGDTTTSATSIDSGAGVMMLAFIVLLWMRFGGK